MYAFGIDLISFYVFYNILITEELFQWDTQNISNNTQQGLDCACALVLPLENVSQGSAEMTNDFCIAWFICIAADEGKILCGSVGH